LVRLNLVDSKGRTVLPNTTGITVAGFDHFTLRVVNSVNAAQGLPVALTGDITLAGTITSTPIPLAPGETYKFTVTAFSGSASTTAQAIGIKQLAVSTAPAGKTLSIELKEIVDGSGTGTLTVTTLPVAGYGTATLALSPISANASPAVSGFDLKGGNYSSALNSGYYLMTIALTQSGKAPASVVEVVHIYQNITTQFTGPYPTLRTNEYLVEYEYNDAGNAGDPDETVVHGANIQNIPPTTTISHSTLTDIFGGWFTTNTPSAQIPATQITASSKIIKPLQLYARWEPSTVDVAISGVTLAWSGNVPPDFTGSTASYSQSLSTITINMVVANATAYQATYQWYVDGTLQLGQTTNTLTITGDVDTATKWYQAGVHTIILVAYEKGDSTPYSGSWQINCTTTP